MEIRETTLAGNQWIEDMHRLIWKTRTNRNKDNNLPPLHDIPVVTLRPMEIKTFVIKVDNK